MFGSKKQPKAAGIRQAKFTTLIAHDIEIDGDVRFGEGLRLDGHVRGNVVAKPDSHTLLVLSDRGCVTGNVHGHDIVINGRIVGDVVAEHFVELQANAHVTGNIEYLQLRMDAGATVEGKLSRRDGTSAAPAPAARHPDKPQGSPAAAPDGATAETVTP